MDMKEVNAEIDGQGKESRDLREADRAEARITRHWAIGFGLTLGRLIFTAVRLPEVTVRFGGQGSVGCLA